MRIRVLLLAAAAAGAVACGDPRGAVVVKTGTSADTAEQVMYGVRAPITESGVRRGELIADSMYVFNNQNRFEFFNGHVEFNTPTGAPDGTMSGDRGLYDLQTQTLEGWGNVVVRTVEGNTLRSPHVVYDQRQNRVTSDTTFQLVQRGRGTFAGFGLEADSRLSGQGYKCTRNCAWSGDVVLPR